MALTSLEAIQNSKIGIREFTRNIYRYLKPATYHITKDGVITFKITITVGDEIYKCDRQCIISTRRGTRFSRNPTEKCEVCGKISTNLYEIEDKEVCKNCQLGIEGFTAWDGTIHKPNPSILK